ncbi:Rapid ALkalinization Factor [Rhynchospora pubera]|uniref:Rapid ALkalinization Factor n=1 Tax=Rhynchospora pubera TaxID=906938 RepID=A0AAV8DN42_9POAL|nr:Rapid ALkalinization Factor [Rhynchospora pubera]KAJ4820673.1 Rapid ALkalinization Factor [Rhynchospora pubera]
MALRHALVLLLVLTPLIVTAESSVESIDAVLFEWDYQSTELTFDFVEPDHDSDIDYTDGLLGRVPFTFFEPELSVCYAGSCDSSGIRHRLAFRSRYISYDALKKNRVPCGRRGWSYYNCRRGGRANPYHRGCSFITRCARILD